MESGYSLADLMAVSGKETSGFGFGGVGGLILILLFFIIFGGAWGNGWGNRNYNQDGITDLERDVLNGNSNTQKAVMQSQYDTLLGFKDAQYQLSGCCCKLENAIHQEGEATRALITNNTIQELRDRLATANNALTAQTITDNVVNRVKPCPIPAYLTCSPYFSYGYYGNNGCGGQSIF